MKKLSLYIFAIGFTIVVLTIVVCGFLVHWILRIIGFGDGIYGIINFYI